MRNHILSAVLSAALLFTAVPVSTAVPEQGEPETERISITTAGPISEIPEDPGFTDAVGHWAQDAIGRFLHLGILSGSETLFYPDQPITRGEVAALLQRIMHYKTASPLLFDDVSGHRYAEDIQKLRAAGVMLGDEANRALPDSNVTREEAMVLIARAFGFQPAVEDVPDSDEAQDDPQAETFMYADYDIISDWAQGYIMAMTNAGFLHGSDNGCFLPEDPLTRAEAITVLHNMITTYIDEPGDYNYRPYEGLADFVIIASDDVTILNYDIGGNVILTEGVVYETVLFKSCNHYGKIFEYTADGFIRRLKAASYIVPINENLPVCSYDSDLFAKDERGVMHYNDPTRPYWFGVDVSSWQGEIDWHKLKEEGVYFAFVRAGYRGYETGSLNTDQYFHKNVQGALDAGIKVGVYFFSQALNAQEAYEEATYVLELIRGYDITFPVVFDWETVSSDTARTNDIETEALCQAANVFCSTVEEAGYIPMVYCNQSVSLLYYELSRIDAYDFWYAEYRDKPTFYYDFDIWQYGCTGKFAGVPNADLDVNISFVDYSARPR